MTNPIRSYREKHGLKLEEFAERIGVRKGTVSKWENGILPSTDSARLIETRTEGAITRQELRPDIWEPSTAPAPIETGAAA